MPKIFEALPGAVFSSHLAKVVAVDDPDSLGRVSVRLLAYDGHEHQDAEIWARVASPFAGEERGCYMLPDVGDEVLVVFPNGDARAPVVVGGLWNGAAAPPETLGGAGDRVDRWAIVGKHGTRIAIVEESEGQARIHLTTPGGGPAVVMDQSGGGKIEVTGSGTTITIDPSGVSIQTGATVSVEASKVDVSAGMVDVSAGFSKFSGVVQCDTLITNSVISAAYTPGAGNIW